MPRPGFVLDVDRSTPPTLFWHGEGLSLEQLPPDRSRIIYAPEPLPAIDDVDAAIRHALLHPIDQDPLPALLFPGMTPDDRLRRRQPAAAQDAPARRPPAGDRGRARPGRRGRRRRRRADRRPRPPPPHERGRAAPRRRRPRLRRLRAPRPAHPARRRGPRQPGVPRHHPRGRGGRDQQAGGAVGPARLRQHQPRRHGRRLEVDGHRAGLVPLAAPPPQPGDHGGQPQLHGPAPQRAAQEQLADGQGARRLGRQGVPDRDDAQHRHLPPGRSSSSPSGSGSGRPRTAPRTSARPSRWPSPRTGCRARCSTASRRRTR